MELSIIIPCYNAAATIGAQLGALVTERWEGEWEVVVVDNGSSDDTLSVVRGYFGRLPHLRVLSARASQGAAYARNIGVRKARGRNVAFLDADDVIQPGWIAAIGEALRSAPFVASRFEFRSLNAPRLVGLPMAPQEDGLQRYANPKFLAHAGTCGLGVRKALHEEIGGFDQSMAVLEDTDYCWRLQLSGVPLTFVPDAVVAVRYRPTLRASLRQARVWGRENIRLYLRYRGLGMARHHVGRELRDWRRLARQLGGIGAKESRLRWRWTFHLYLGRLVGWIRYGLRPATVGVPRVAAKPVYAEMPQAPYCPAGAGPFPAPQAKVDPRSQSGVDASEGVLARGGRTGWR
ncbi:glycosyltransferase family 2 protein [Ectothiorhodospiraceae bacterium 2226]|nr:glycosyltransferase family 2 protein [Ectothiorhodospiraceae bacterium 2226]